MSALLTDVQDDLRGESEQLDNLVAPLDAGGWRSPTPAEGWTIAHQIAHLAWTDEWAIAAATDKDAWDATVVQALADPEGFVDAGAAAGATADPTTLLERWRASRQRLAEVLDSLPAGTKLPWYGPPMSPTSMATARFMETWAHGRDVADALDVTLPADDAVRHVVHIGVRTRDFSFRNRELDPPAEQFRIELTLPGGEELAYGLADAAQSVTGAAYDFALLVTQRRHRTNLDLIAKGPDAERWLEIAQAFAGPAGPGREPR